MKLKEITDLIGRAINDKKIVAFLKKHKFSYPKKDTISNRKMDRSYWVNDGDICANLLFSIDCKNSQFKPVKAQRKGVFYPILTNITIYYERVIKDIPFGLKFGMTKDEVINTIGEPTTKSSDIASINLEDGKESFYDWKKRLDIKDKELDLCLRIYCDDILYEFDINLHENRYLFTIYDELLCENPDALWEKDKWSNRSVSYFMFIRWLIENDFVTKTEENSTLLENIKKGKDTVQNYLKSLNQGYFGIDEVSKNTYAIRRYMLNLNSDYRYVRNDFGKIFSIDEFLEGDKSIEFSEENYQKMKEFWDKKDFSK